MPSMTREDHQVTLSARAPIATALDELRASVRSERLVASSTQAAELEMASMTSDPPDRPGSCDRPHQTASAVVPERDDGAPATSSDRAALTAPNRAAGLPTSELASDRPDRREQDDADRGESLAGLAGRCTQRCLDQAAEQQDGAADVSRIARISRAHIVRSAQPQPVLLPQLEHV